MKMTELYIKNMVCPRCIKVVKEELEKLDIPIVHIELGLVKTTRVIDAELKQQVKQVLQINGFELIDDKKSRIIEQIKTLIIEKIHYSENEGQQLNSSDYLAQELGHDYSYLSHLFSSVEGITIEKYTINQKIEKVKELLLYNELSLKEISYQLGYSSVQHLSNQFKKHTGLRPSQFKSVSGNKRKTLDSI